MPTHNPNNERIKRRYFSFLKEAKRHSEATLDTVAKALARFEEDTRYRDFKAFHHEQAVAFKKHLAEQQSQRTGGKLSKATMHSTLVHLRGFFQWLAGQPGYRSKLNYSDAEYFNLSEKDTRIATARREQPGPTLEQVLGVIASMPSKSDVERRDRAVIAFALLTGSRDGAVASLKLKHVNLARSCVVHDAREVKTKFSKTFTAYFFPVGEDVRGIVADWVRFLREEKLWGESDPLFPATDVAVGAEKLFTVVGLKRSHWSTAAPIRKIFRTAFERAGVPYFHPHTLRKTLGRVGLERCRTAEEFKAWSQNLAHEDVLTTFMSYGEVAADRQAEIIRGLAEARPPEQDAEVFARAVARYLRDTERLT